MIQPQYAPDLSELWEETSRLEAELVALKARLKSELATASAVAMREDPIPEPWDVAPYCWAIKAKRVALRQTGRAWHGFCEKRAQHKLSRHNRHTQLAWSDTSHDEPTLHLV